MEKHNFIAEIDSFTEDLAEEGLLEQSEDNAYFIMGLSNDNRFSYHCVGRPQRLAAGIIHCVEDDPELFGLFVAALDAIASRKEKEKEKKKDEDYQRMIQIFCRPSKIKS